MTSRDEILQTFQEVTGMDDIGVCMSVLEHNKWSLEAAINSLMPQDQIFSSSQQSSQRVVQAGSSRVTTTAITNNSKNSVIDLTNDGASASTKPLPPSAHMIKFNVMYNETKYTVSLPLTSTLKELKERLKELTGLPCSNQKISGVPASVTEETQFYDKKYDKLKGTSLLMLDPLVPPSLWGPHVMGTHLPPNPIIPTNSPIHVSDDESLDEEQRSSESASQDNESIVEDEDGRSSSNEGSIGEDEEAESQCDDTNDGFDDDIFVDTSLGTESQVYNPLIPEGCEDPVEALQFFSACFTTRYGELHPLFFIGSLADAVKEATGVPADQRRPMFIYLHHDSSVLSNIFCSQLLCVESIVSYLTSNYVVWAWDLTREQLKRKLLDMVKESFGVSVATHVDDIKPDHLPVILIVYKSKGQIDVRDIIQGHTDPDKLLTALISANEMHQSLATEDLKDEQERKAREDMIKAQEKAYQDSLLADKEKERQRQEEEEIKALKEFEEKREREKKEEERQKMLDSIPPEPEKSCTEKVSSIRMRFPDGSVDQRRFLASLHTVQMLLNYIGSKGYPPSDYKILTSYPKRNITQIDPDQTLMQASLFPTETLHIEDDS